jgi:hypothetical protein
VAKTSPVAMTASILLRAQFWTRGFRVRGLS